MLCFSTDFHTVGGGGPWGPVFLLQCPLWRWRQQPPVAHAVSPGQLVQGRAGPQRPAASLNFYSVKPPLCQLEEASLSGIRASEPAESKAAGSGSKGPGLVGVSERHHFFCPWLLGPGIWPWDKQLVDSRHKSHPGTEAQPFTVWQPNWHRDGDFSRLDAMGTKETGGQSPLLSPPTYFYHEWASLVGSGVGWSASMGTGVERTSTDG